MRRIQVNGKERETAARSLEALLKELGIEPGAKGVAAAVNEKVAPKSRWHETPLAEGDQVEIIRAVQGG